ncbi:MAG: Ig-like domain-containing protein, partial [Pirellulaceae bacterium]|nr:Ig-like domain-containing protein [Pirellulaceae bacterium]
ATVTITVNNVNDAPIAVNDAYSDVLEHGVDIVLDVTENDSPGPNDADAGDTVTIVSVQGFSRGGSATISPDGQSLLYTPARRPEGVETFTYTIEDSFGLTATATVTVNIIDENDDPTAVDDEVMALKDFANQTLDVLVNDSIFPDPVGSEQLTIIGLGPSNEATIATLHGTATIATGGKSILYTPNPGFESEGVNFDQFTYTIGDGRGGTATALVTVDVIDAVPSDISGVVYLDVNNNGVKDAAEIELAGVEVTLTGTNIRGQALNITVKTDVDGVFRFENILPNLEGSLEGYSIAAAQPKFLIDGKDGMLDSTVADDLNPGVAGNDLFTGIQLGLWGTGRAEGNYMVGERGLSSKYISLAQYLSSTRKGLAVATNLAGDDYWFTVLQGWEGLESVHVQLASDLTYADVWVNGSADPVRLNYTKYHVAGDRATGEYMIYFNGSAVELGFDLSGDDVVANGSSQAEGEAGSDSIDMYAADFAREADLA